MWDGIVNIAASPGRRKRLTNREEGWKLGLWAFMSVRMMHSFIYFIFLSGCITVSELVSMDAAI